MLLNELLMWATPKVMFLRSRLRGRRAAAAGLVVLAIYLRTFFFPATVFFGPLRVRALVWVRWPWTGQALAVADPLVAADLHLPLDVLGDVPAQVALDLQVGVDVVAEPGDLLVGQVPDPGVGAGLGGRADLLRGRPADAEDVGEGDLQPLLAGDVHAGDTGHVVFLLSLRLVRASALALLVARVFADDDDPPVPADHLALLTHRLDAGSNLHVARPSSRSGGPSQPPLGLTAGRSRPRPVRSRRGRPAHL